MPLSNELDIFVSQNTKEKLWNMGYIDLAIIFRNYFTVPYEMQNCISVDNGRLVIHVYSIKSSIRQGTSYN
jgi:hypothetical protein